MLLCQKLEPLVLCLSLRTDGRGRENGCVPVLQICAVACVPVVILI